MIEGKYIKINEFLHSSNKQVQQEIHKTALSVASKHQIHKNKTNENIQGFYIEDCKALVRKFK